MLMVLCSNDQPAYAHNLQFTTRGAWDNDKMFSAVGQLYKDDTTTPHFHATANLLFDDPTHSLRRM